MRESTVRTDNRGLEFLLALGYLAVAAAMVIARSAPTTGYEVSIYGATPILVWELLGGALLIATPVMSCEPTDYRSNIQPPRSDVSIKFKSSTIIYK